MSANPTNNTIAPAQAAARWRPLLAGLFQFGILGTIGLVIIIVMVLLVILAPWLAPHDPNLGNLSMRNLPPLTSADYPLGTDPLGRVRHHAPSEPLPERMADQVHLLPSPRHDLRDDGRLQIVQRRFRRHRGGRVECEGLEPCHLQTAREVVEVSGAAPERGEEDDGMRHGSAG